MYRSKRLEKWYHTYNKAYFGSSLPRKVAIFWARHGEIKGRMGETRLYRKGKKKYLVIVIHRMLSQLDRMLKWDSIWHLCLLHEMVHLAHPEQFHHGPDFQKTMIRLAHRGAFRALW